MIERLHVLHYWWCWYTACLLSLYNGQKYERLPYVPGGFIDGWKLNIRETLLIAQRGLVIKNSVFTYPKNFDFNWVRIAVNATNVSITSSVFKVSDDDMQQLYDLHDEAQR